MLSRVTSGRLDVLERRCLSCGHSDDRIDFDPFCPRCGCDFTLRPPRSYAEMEGLIPPGDPRNITTAAHQGDRLYDRWALFAAFSLGLLLSLLYLTAEVLNSV